eukprot:gene2359-506_t
MPSAESFLARSLEIRASFTKLRAPASMLLFLGAPVPPPLAFACPDNEADHSTRWCSARLQEHSNELHGHLSVKVHRFLTKANEPDEAKRLYGPSTVARVRALAEDWSSLVEDIAALETEMQTNCLLQAAEAAAFASLQASSANSVAEILAARAAILHQQKDAHLEEERAASRKERNQARNLRRKAQQARVRAECQKLTQLSKAATLVEVDSSGSDNYAGPQPAEAGLSANPKQQQAIDTNADVTSDPPSYPTIPCQKMSIFELPASAASLRLAPFPVANSAFVEMRPVESNHVRVMMFRTLLPLLSGMAEDAEQPEATGNRHASLPNTPEQYVAMPGPRSGVPGPRVFTAPCLSGPAPALSSEQQDPASTSYPFSGSSSDEDGLEVGESAACSDGEYLEQVVSEAASGNRLIPDETHPLAAAQPIYVVRKRQGKRQSGHTTGGGGSIGGQIRAQQEKKWKLEVRGLALNFGLCETLFCQVQSLLSGPWAEALTSAVAVWIHAPGPSNLSILKAGGIKLDSRLRQIPFSCGRPVFAEANAAFQRLTTLRLYSASQFVQPILKK